MEGHVVAGHSGCGWTTKQAAELPAGAKLVMCDKEPQHAACKSATAYPTHLLCQGESCKEVAKGYRTAAQLADLAPKQ